MIIENIKNIESNLAELKVHPCCFDFSFDEYNRLTIIFPHGYYYNNCSGVRLNESSKIKNIMKGIDICEKVWNDSCFWK